MNETTLQPFAEPLKAVQQLLQAYHQQGIVSDGVAASLLGKPRFTADIDLVLLLSVDDLPALIQTAKQVGLHPRIADAENFARKHRVLLLVHEQSQINVDISLGVLPFEIEAVERSQVQEIGDLLIRLPTASDLIILKAIAHRPKDLLDIQGVIESNSNLDRERIKSWVTQFAELLELPELWDDIAGWLNDE
ncbi:MAG: hypothetical protein Fur0022_25770 [Anaerolineales bacterium]